MEIKKKDFQIIIKELEKDHLIDSFFDTLSNLTEIGKDVYNKEFSQKILEKIKNAGNIRIFVAIKDSDIVGSITAIIEQKFIHNGGKICHIEDVVTRKGFEKLGIGSQLVEKVLELAKNEKCYKVILNSSEYNFKFYENLGFYKHDIGMRYNIEI
ncbi:MAG TPA: GNAT family N-acetyltransferase [Nitrososphaeraceae archaeon]